MDSMFVHRTSHAFKLHKREQKKRNENISIRYWYKFDEMVEFKEQ